MEWLLSLLMLSALEIVLGIDNLVFISILTGRLPAKDRPFARRWGMAGAFFTRICLLMTLSWISRLTDPIVTIGDVGLSGKSLILLGGGAFLIYKATTELHAKVEGDEGHGAALQRAARSLGAVVVQILIVDMVFSLDSVITAVGMTDQIPVMIAANAVALAVMLAVGGMVSDFIDHHPTIKVLALSFLLLIGTVLMADGLGFHIPKAYVYFAMGFSLGVELLNLRHRPKSSKS